MTLSIWNEVGDCATAILNTLAECVQDYRHAHHGDVVDGIRLALVEMATAVDAGDPLTTDYMPNGEVAALIAKHVGGRLRLLRRRLPSGFVLAKAVWYVRHGLSCARPCTIDVAITHDIEEFSTSDRFAAYREHVERVRELIQRPV